MAWSSALSPFLGGATFHSLEAWGFNWEEVVPERGRGKGVLSLLVWSLGKSQQTKKEERK